MSGPDLLFIAGVPASGKSYFGKWLESECGYIHIDPEENDRLDSMGVHALWDSCFAPKNCASFARRLKQLGQPVLFNWAFPPHLFDMAAALKKAGFASWWFEADVQQARRAYVQKHGQLGRFDEQLADLQSIRGAIEKLFQPNIIVTLDAAGGRVGPREIWRRISRAA